MIRLFSRRQVFAVPALALALPAVAALPHRTSAQDSAAAHEQDSTWNMNFRRFTREFNLFVIDLNEGTYNAKRWKRVVSAFNELEGKTCP